MTFEKWWEKYGSQMTGKSAEDLAAEAWSVSGTTERHRAAAIARKRGKNVGCLCGHFDICPHIGQIDEAYQIAKEIERG